MVLALTLFAGNLRRRSSGRAFSAVRESESVFSHVGGSVASYKLLAFWLSSVYAAVAGVLYGALVGPLNSGLFNLQFSLYVLAIAIVGGMSSLVGPYVAGMAFAWYPQMLSGIEAIQYWTYVIGGVSLIVFVVTLPGGMAALPERAAGWVRAARHKPGADAAEGHWELDLSESAVPVVAGDDAVVVGNGDRGDFEARLTQERAERWLAREERRRVRQSGNGNGNGVHPPPPGRSSGRDVRHRARRHSQRPLLRVEDVTMRFGGTLALSGVSMTVRPGEIHGLVGPNGAGKSTLFDCITGVRRPQSGGIAYKRRELLGLPTHTRARLGIARTFQHTNVLPGLSVLENLLVADQMKASANLLADGLGLEIGRHGVATARRRRAPTCLPGPVRRAGHPRRRPSPRHVEAGRAGPGAGGRAGPRAARRAGGGARRPRVGPSGPAATDAAGRRPTDHPPGRTRHGLVMEICDPVTVLDYGKVLSPRGLPDGVRTDPRSSPPTWENRSTRESESSDAVVG